MIGRKRANSIKARESLTSKTEAGYMAAVSNLVRTHSSKLNPCKQGGSIYGRQVATEAGITRSSTIKLGKRIPAEAKRNPAPAPEPNRQEVSKISGKVTRETPR